jgi:hypothetical protein
MEVPAQSSNIDAEFPPFPHQKKDALPLYRTDGSRQVITNLSQNMEIPLKILDKRG